jgi:uncharacterized membrane protein
MGFSATMPASVAGLLVPRFDVRLFVRRLLRRRRRVGELVGARMDARSFLDAAGAKSVEDAVARAEARTSAEVVCVIATESGRYDGARALVGLVVALIDAVADELAPKLPPLPRAADELPNSVIVLHPR